MTSLERGVLWLTRWPPYSPRLGGDIDYSRELMEGLARLVPVRGLVFGSPGDTPPRPPGLSWTMVEAREQPRWASVVHPLPNVAFRHLSAAYLRAVIEAARSADVVMVDFISLLWLVAPLRKALERAGGRRPAIVVVNHNFEYGVRRQMVAAEAKPILKAALAYDCWKAGLLERGANRLADGLVANTEADLQAFAEVADTPGVVVMPAYAGAKAAPRVIDNSIPPRISIIGNHEAHHKRMVLDRALAALAAQGVERLCPIDVVGAGETASFEARYPGFNFFGYKEDLNSYLQTVRFGLIPDDIGGGFKHRALTHAFQRVPMLAVKGALAGMGFSAGRDYVETETLEAMAAAAPGLLGDFPRLNALQEAAFRHCETAFDWDERARTLYDFLAGLPVRAA